MSQLKNLLGDIMITGFVNPPNNITILVKRGTKRKAQEIANANAAVLKDVVLHFQEIGEIKKAVN